jgi:flavin-dependent dehydrogenase
MRQLTDGAAAPDRNGVTADFSYVCRPFAGPGYFLVGDAATFMDPIFSTGVYLGMMTGVLAADSVAALRDGANPQRVRRRYSRYFSGATGVFFRLIRAHYEHSFRELFLERRGPLAVHRAVISILSGNVFPKARWQLRWRLQLMLALAQVQKHVMLAPRRSEHSMLEASEAMARRAGRER